MTEIQEQYRAMMNGVAQATDEFFNPPGKPKKIAFVLLLAEFGEIAGGRVNYISNGQRADIISMLHEILARLEGRAVFDEPPTEAKQ